MMCSFYFCINISILWSVYNTDFVLILKYMCKIYIQNSYWLIKNLSKPFSFSSSKHTNFPPKISSLKHCKIDKYDVGGGIPWISSDIDDQGVFLVWLVDSWSFWVEIFGSIFGSLYISGKLPTYPSPKPTFCLKWKVSVDVGIEEGRWAVSQKCIMICIFGGELDFCPHSIIPVT